MRVRVRALAGQGRFGDAKNDDNAAAKAARQISRQGGVEDHAAAALKASKSVRSATVSRGKSLRVSRQVQIQEESSTRESSPERATRESSPDKDAAVLQEERALRQELALQKARTAALERAVENKKKGLDSKEKVLVEADLLLVHTTLHAIPASISPLHIIYAFLAPFICRKSTATEGNRH